jgi:hypothetical protein
MSVTRPAKTGKLLSLPDHSRNRAGGVFSNCTTRDRFFVNQLKPSAYRHLTDPRLVQPEFPIHNLFLMGDSHEAIHI